MKCEQFEGLLADALGDELPAANWKAFEGHMAACAACRHEYESAAATLSTLRSLVPPALPAAGEGAISAGLSTLELVPVAHESAVRRVAPSALSGLDSSASAPRRWTIAVATMRYAAVIALAFWGGFFYHSERPAVNFDPSNRTTSVAPQTEGRIPGLGLSPRSLANAAPRSFETALAGAHVQNPSRSDLAKCLVAIFQRSH